MIPLARRAANSSPPEALKGKYQAFTQADLTQMRAAGYDQPFRSVEHGTGSYVRWLLQHPQ